MKTKIALGLILLGSQLAFANHSVTCSSDNVELWYNYFGDSPNCDDNYYVMSVTVKDENHKFGFNAPIETGYEDDLGISISPSGFARFKGEFYKTDFVFSMPSHFENYQNRGVFMLGDFTETMSCTVNVRPYWGAGRPVPENKVECVGSVE